MDYKVIEVITGLFIGYLTLSEEEVLKIKKEKDFKLIPV